MTKRPCGMVPIVCFHPCKKRKLCAAPMSGRRPEVTGKTGVEGDFLQGLLYTLQTLEAHTLFKKTKL